MAVSKYGYSEFLDILNKFKVGQDALSDVELLIKDGENDLDPLTLLRLYQSERTIENSIELASKFIQGKEVSIIKGEKELIHFMYGGGDLTAKFTKAPWLLDVFFSMCQGLLLKKLTPPSDAFNDEGRESEELK